MILTFRQMVIMTTCNIIASSSLAARAQVPCSYSVTILPDVDCGVWQAPGNAVAMNNNGVVVGHFISCGGSQNDSFYWNGGATLTVIPKPQWMQSFVAADINDEGLIVGTANTDWAGQRAYIYNIATGQWTELPPVVPNAVGWSGASAINASGQVCGWRSIGNTINPYNAFFYDPASSQFTDLGVMNGPNSWASGISNSGTIVGTTGSIGGTNQRAFVHQQGRTTIFDPVPGALNSSGIAINDAGQILIGGITQLSPALGVAFVFDGNQFLRLPPLKGFSTVQARSMNSSAVVVGNSGNQSVGMIGTIWFNGLPVDLSAMIEPSGFSIAYGRDVSDLGQILAVRGGSAPQLVLLTPLDRRPGDVNCDQIVDVDDLLAVVFDWGICVGCPADLDLNGVVNVVDLLIVIQNWTVLP